jgi:hypothetical protein
MIRTLIHFGLLLVFLGIAGCATDKPAPSRDFAPAPPTAELTTEPTPEQLRTETLLNQRESDVSYQAVSLADVLSKFGTIVGVPINADWDKLSKSGIGKSHPVAVHLKKVRRSKALKEILTDAGTRPPPQESEVELTYFIDRHGQIMVTTFNAYAAEFMSTHKYDITDLLPDRHDKREWRERTAAVIALTQETIDPVHWKDAGGIFTITFEDGVLIVCATPEIHRAMTNLLQQLREPDVKQE